MVSSYFPEGEPDFLWMFTFSSKEESLCVRVDHKLSRSSQRDWIVKELFDPGSQNRLIVH